jgi:hypothetical protein
MRPLLSAAGVLAGLVCLLPVFAGADGSGSQTGKEAEMTDVVALMRAWLEVFAEGDFDAFPGSVSPDFVLRLPFVPPGVASEIRGREAAQRVLRASGERRSKLVFADVAILRTEDPELVVTTARAEAKLANGRIYRNEYIMLTRIRGRMVLEHVEYLNPLALMEPFANPE